MIIPEHIRRLMTPEDRASYEDPKILDTKQAEPRMPKLERDEHAIFENWLLSHRYSYRHSRTDKPTRERCGAPDFTVYAKKIGHPFDVGKCLAIEFKLPGNRLSEAQIAWADNYGGIVHVVATAAEAILLVTKNFGS